MVIVRVVKSNDCPVCKDYIPRLQEQGYDFEIYDGDAPENQDKLDKWKIDEFPVVQIVHKKDGMDFIKYQFPPGKTFAPRLIDQKKKQIEAMI